MKLFNNKGRKVKLDPIETKKGTAIRVRYWTGSQWNTETLPDKLTGNREYDQALIAVAESFRSATEHKLFLSGVEGASIFKGKIPFIKYYKETLKDKAGYKCLYHLEKFPLKNRAMKSIDKDWVEKLLDFLKSRVKSTNSVHTYYAVIKKVLNQAVREDIIRKSPALLVAPVDRVPKEIEYLTEEEIEALINTDTKSEELKRCFLFSCYTGIRLGDLRKLTFGNIDIKENKIKFIVSKTKRKTKRPLEIHLHKIAKQLAFQNMGENVIPSPSLLIFPDLKGYNTISCQLKVLAKKAGIKKHVHFHMGRSSFATILLKRGTPIEVVSKLLGHSTISMTLQHYAKILDEAKLKAISSLPDIKFGS